MSETTTTNGKVTAVAKAADTLEIGSSGLAVNNGRVLDEFHPKLKGRQAAKAYREMQDNDAVVGGILYAIEMLLREVDWHVDPAEDTGNDAEAERWAIFIEGCLDDMSMTWPQTLGATMSFLPFGWAFHELVYKIRGGDVDDPTRRSKFDDGLYGWRKIALRSQESLIRWEFDTDGGVQAFVQTKSEGYGEVAIPIEKGLLFRTTAARSNPEGRSVLRNAYRSWYYKKRIEEIEATGIERDLAGLPVVYLPAEYLADNASVEKKAVAESMKQLVSRIKRNDQEGIVFPSELDENNNELWRLELLTTGGRRQFDTDQIIARYDQRIAMTVLADWILLGHEAVGSKALGVSKVQLFTVALAAWLDEIGSVYNEYGIPRLLKLNGVDRRYWPKLAHDEVEEVDLDRLGAFIRDTVGVGAIIPDEGIDSQLRSISGLPQADPTTADV